MLSLTIHHHSFSDYENEIFPVLHFMLDRLQIGLHIQTWNTRLLQKFRSSKTSIYHMVWHEPRETFTKTTPETLSGQRHGWSHNSL